MVGNMRQKLSRKAPTKNMTNIELNPYTGQSAISKAMLERNINSIAAWVI